VIVSLELSDLDEKAVIALYHSTMCTDSITELSDLDEMAVIALYHSTMCTDAHNQQKLWGTSVSILMLFTPLHIWGPVPIPMIDALFLKEIFIGIF